MRPAVKPQALDRPSVAAAWWSWWARHRLPHLVKRRVYLTDVDAVAWVPYQHEGREKVRPRRPVSWGVWSPVRPGGRCSTLATGRFAPLHVATLGLGLGIRHPLASSRSMASAARRSSATGWP